jgi:peptidoglycan LD-endopeptidase LytH
MTGRWLRFPLSGAVVVVALFAASGLLPSERPVTSEPHASLGAASNERAALPSVVEGTPAANIPPLDSVPLENTFISGEAAPPDDTMPDREAAEPPPSRAAGSGITPSPGSLLVPVAGVRPEGLVDTYTHARSEGRRHDAIDIMARRGTHVIAAAAGTVLKLFQSERGGITLYQLGADRRTVYYYAHLDRYAPGIVEGMRLEPGDTIGYVGDTGNAGAGNYHLHFEVSTTADPRKYWGGTPVNPYPLLGGAGPPRE